MNKIVHLIFSMEVGGAENLLVDIANEQCKSKDVSIIIINENYNNGIINRISKEIKIFTINRKKGIWSWIYILKIWVKLLQIKPDVIHCHNHKTIKLLLFWRKIAVITVHNVRKPIQNLKMYNKVFSISEAVKQDLFCRGSLGSSVVYNGVAFESIKKKSSYAYDKNKAFKIVQVSRLYHQQKGQDIALQAIGKLDSLGYSNLELYFVGDGPSRAYLEETAKELAIENKVFFLGEMNRNWIYTNLSNFDILIQPSLFEGFGLTVVEGLAAGLPIIASNVDGPAEILRDLPSGFLFEAGNSNALAQTILNVMNLTLHEKIQNTCADSIGIALSKYSIVLTSNEYIRHYPN